MPAVSLDPWHTIVAVNFRGGLALVTVTLSLRADINLRRGDPAAEPDVTVPDFEVFDPPYTIPGLEWTFPQAGTVIDPNEYLDTGIYYGWNITGPSGEPEQQLAPPQEAWFAYASGFIGGPAPLSGPLFDEYEANRLHWEANGPETQTPPYTDYSAKRQLTQQITFAGPDGDVEERQFISEFKTVFDPGVTVGGNNSVIRQFIVNMDKVRRAEFVQVGDWPTEHTYRQVFDFADPFNPVLPPGGDNLIIRNPINTSVTYGSSSNYSVTTAVPLPGGGHSTARVRMYGPSARFRFAADLTLEAYSETPPGPTARWDNSRSIADGTEGVLAQFNSAGFI